MKRIIHETDIGTVFEVAITDDNDDVIDISSASVKLIRFEKPDGTKIVRDATFNNDGSDGIITYTTVEGDIDLIGDWQVQGYAEITSGKFSSMKKRFRVENTLRTQQAEPEYPNIIVSGAGTTAVNGVYEYHSMQFEKPFYVMGGYFEEGSASILWMGIFDIESWLISLYEGSAYQAYYSSDDNVATPDLVTTWTPAPLKGELPVPAVTADT
jgi:hypothetical protein